MVTDCEEQIQDRLGDLVRSRPPGTTPPTAIRGFVLVTVDSIRSIPPELWHGELGYLAAISPTVHRLALELTERQAEALAEAIGDTSDVLPEIAKLQGIAHAAVFQVIIDEAAGAPATARPRRRSPKGRPARTSFASAWWLETNSETNWARKHATTSEQTWSI